MKQKFDASSYLIPGIKIEGHIQSGYGKRIRLDLRTTYSHNDVELIIDLTRTAIYISIKYAKKIC